MPYGYHSGAWPPHAFVAPAAGYQALPASYAAPTSYAAAPAAPAGYAAPPAAHSQEGGSGLVYSVAALDAHAGPPSISPVPPPQPVAASAAFGAADAVPVPTQQQQQPGGHTAAAVTPGRDEEEQGSAQAAATQAQGAEAAVEFSPAASPRDEHWHWVRVALLSFLCAPTCITRARLMRGSWQLAISAVVLPLPTVPSAAGTRPTALQLRAFSLAPTRTQCWRWSGAASPCYSSTGSSQTTSCWAC